VDPVTGVLKGWGPSLFTVIQTDEASGGPSGAIKNNVHPTVEFNIGQDVRGALFGYREYAGGPQYIVLNRCPTLRGADCKLEFHELPKDAQGQKGSTVGDLTEQFGNMLGGSKKTFTLVVGSGEKAKSQQNGGDARMDPGGDGGGVTLVQVLRIPTMASGINLEPQGQGLAVTRHLAMTFTGCTQQDANVTVKAFHAANGLRSVIVTLGYTISTHSYRAWQIRRECGLHRHWPGTRPTAAMRC
jgi:hypothetical protein